MATSVGMRAAFQPSADCCPNCPGARVPHRCGIAAALAAASAGKGGKGKASGKGRGVQAAAAGQAAGDGCARAQGRGDGSRRAGADGDEVGSRCPAVVYCLPVPAAAARSRGRILGEGGENFRHIQQQAGVRLVLEPSSQEPNSDGMQVRILGGRNADMDSAVSLVRDLLSSCASAGASQGEGRSIGKAGGRQAAALATRCVPVPSPALGRGRLLGEGGRNFKQIQEQTGARLVLEPQGGELSAEADFEAMQVRVVGGRRADMDRATALLQELFDSLATPAEPDSGCARGKGKGAAGGKADGKGRRQQQADMRALAEGKRSEAEGLLERATALQQEVRELRASEPVPEWGCTAPLLEGEVLAAARAATTAAKTQRETADRSSWEEASSLALERAEAFWQALDAKREEARVALEAGTGTPEEAANRREERQKRLQERREKAHLAAELSSKARALRRESEQLSTLASTGGAKGSTGAGRLGGFCALFPLGACPFKDGECPRGAHGEPPVPSEDRVLAKTSRAKLQLLQQKWRDAGGIGELVGAWQVENPRLELLLRATEGEFATALGSGSDVIDGWHGTAEENVFSIALNGFDPKRRCGQAFGAGEYFAKNPMVSVGYARGGAFMFLCKLVLGKADLDHTWVPSMQYYVLKQRNCRVQAVPLFLVKFQASSGALARRLQTLPGRTEEELSALATRQMGALRPCEARRDAGMDAPFTRHLWLGWLSPSLRSQDDDAVAEDVAAFLKGHEVEQVIPERNGARVGAFVLLRAFICKEDFTELQRRPYQGRYRISVDDQQPSNPRCAGRVCPRLVGPSRYCRGWNLRGHRTWQWGCSFAHPPERRPTHGASYRLEPLAKGSAKYDEIATELTRSSPFVSADGRVGQPRIVAVHRVDNPLLAGAYEERRGFLHDKQGFAMERELWHGTNCQAIPELLTHGLQPPSDTCPSDSCRTSGGKGLCTTLCGADCTHCQNAHCWGKCHMYGLGVYLADLAQKSHRYVREPARSSATPHGGASGRQVYSLLRCRVALGNPYLIEGNLLKEDAMHDFCWCQDPSEALERSAEKFSLSKGHDAFYVRGLSGGQKAGLGVFNSEYIVFHPYQILPLYKVDYVLA